MAPISDNSFMGLKGRFLFMIMETNDRVVREVHNDSVLQFTQVQVKC